MRYLVALLALGALALAGWGTYVHVQADRAVVSYVAEVDHDRPDHDGVSPYLDTPLSRLENFQVNCPTVDGGAVVSCLTPMDGGTSGIERAASSIYVAPISGSTVKIRVGGSDVTKDLGFEVGPSARDGVGVTVDARHSWCTSEGPAQRADVIIGRQ